MYLRRLAILTFIIAFLSTDVLGQEVNFTAKASRTEVGRTERFNVQFTLNAEGDNFQPPDLSAFRVLSGPNRSTSMQIINFERSVEISYSYTLMPRSTGSFQIGPARIEVKGKTYQTQPLSIKVTEQSPRASDPNDPYAQAARLAFFRVLASKTRVYQGEPLVASYKLFFNTNINRPDILEEPDFTGFYKKPIDINRIRTRQESYRGQQYNTAVVRQWLLIPQRSGRLEPGRVDLQIPTEVPLSSRQSFFNRSRRINQTASQEFPAIEVLPLPSAGRPTGFTGGVGQFKITASLSRDEVTTEESLTLRVKVSGSGNLSLLEIPRPEVPSAFEIFDPKIHEKIQVTGAGMQGEIEFEYLLVPRHGGEYKIPSLRFPYFDPAAGRYKVLQTDPLTVKVEGTHAPAGSSPSAATPGKEDVDFINREILYIKTQPGPFQAVDSRYWGTGKFYLHLILLLLIWALLIAAYIVQRRLRQNRAAFRAQRAGQVARKRLRKARKALQRQDGPTFYQELDQAVWAYFSQKLHLPASRLSREVLDDALREKGVSREIIENLLLWLDEVEMARFARSEGQATAHHYQRATELLTQIERAL